MGTIGGGAVEQLAAKDAENCIAEGTDSCVTYDLTAPDSGTGMVCGGKIAVFIEVFSAQPLLQLQQLFLMSCLSISNIKNAPRFIAIMLAILLSWHKYAANLS